ncbi:CDP-glycerol glycerophosphotransferase family protein [Arthrobacter castelli]|uniref:CDP-glycerol glycerophosphotransferase family protein n=1 Tax=Arthrobacter castelli TaxID=271431 RepID=UPI0012DCA258|nr:CDP-glycerol glycerophosphotransferase family protein [Arthrobacter castelli]
MKKWIGRQLHTAITSPKGVATRHWLGLRSVLRSNHELHGVPVPAEIVVYFGDVTTKLYQLEQWLPVLEQLNREHKVLLLFRKVGTLREVKKKTSLPMIFVRRFEDVMDLYDTNDYRLGIYVNNGVTNFQSLTFSRMVHVHVNHGESDKLSMVSNQAKAYDKVFIAGPAAMERHRSVLLDFDESKLAMVGRPQLDLDFPRELAEEDMRTVMYAPTWEGENESNNYTSLDLYGREIVDALLRLPDTRVVYKPHPRIATSRNPEISGAHFDIVQAIEQANIGRSIPHIVSTAGNILAMFNDVETLVTDVSSVGLDFLYLHPDKPLVLSDRRSNRQQLERDAPIARACPVVDETTVTGMDKLISSVLEAEDGSSQRARMRRYYFGDLKKGDSTRAFITAVEELLSERNKRLEDYEFHATSGEAVDT